MVDAAMVDTMIDTMVGATVDTMGGARWLVHGCRAPSAIPGLAAKCFCTLSQHTILCAVQCSSNRVVKKYQVPGKRCAGD